MCVLRAAGAVCVLGLGACASAASHEPTTPAREIVIDEPTVVQGRAGQTVALPPLPQPLASSSESFRRGHGLAIALLGEAGPGTPPGEDAAHKAWVEQTFQPWLVARTQQLQAVVDAFTLAASGPAAERVPSSALVGLCYERLHSQLVAVAPPARIAADAKLERIYRAALNDNARDVLEQAGGGFRHCVAAAAGQHEPAFGLWSELCREHQTGLQRTAGDQRVLAELVAAEREAERIAAEGPRPPGPEVCWAPLAPPRPPVPAAPAAAEAPPVAVPPAAPAKPLRCARDLAAPAAAAPATPFTPRDARYGVRDAETGVRVSVAVTDAETMDPTPLAELPTQHALAACLAEHVRAEEAVTFALHAHLSVDARGRVKNVALTPEPSDAAAPPNKALSRCLQRALGRVAFSCSPSGQDTQARATYCLRRD